MKIKKNDIVLIISGKYKGKKGKILKSFPSKESIIVEGVNEKKRHIRPKKEGEKGQIIKISAPIDSSNVKIVCPKCKKAVRIGFRILKGKKYRICKKCDKEI